MRRHLALIFGLVLLALTAQASDPTSNLRDGDIIFHRSLSSLSQAISLVTESPITHMGMIVIRDGEPYVLEAAGTVRITKLDDFANNGADGHYVVKRLADADKVLTPEVIAKMKAAGEKFIGSPYDGFFGWSDEKLYCSELVWKVYEAVGIKLGELRKIGEYNFNHPIVKEQLRQRYGDRVPVDEPVIAPSDIFALDSLVVVAEK